MSRFIGLMSGTSMDAVDAALLDFSAPGPRLLANHSHPIPADIRSALSEIIKRGRHDIHVQGELDVRLGQLFADACLTLLTNNGIAAADVQAIGSHGQTLFHAPEYKTPFTIQIGDPNTIAEISGITTVADFRRRDVAAGGQGAPLVPAFHKQMFRSQNECRVILNIGGIANITVLAADEHAVLGFDTGPGNTLMDAWANKHLGTPHDQSGKWAQGGTINRELLDECLKDPFFSLSPPKSTGCEHFNLNWLAPYLVDDSAQNIQATLCQLTVETIANEIETHANSCEAVYVCGGGNHNAHLMQALATRLGPIGLHTTEKLGIAPDWVEAAAFAWLAKQTLEGRAGNLPEATGAIHPVVLGAIYPGRNGI